jgi:ABC-type sugar transport system substrate-binding protein
MRTHRNVMGWLSWSGTLGRRSFLPTISILGLLLWGGVGCGNRDNGKKSGDSAAGSRVGVGAGLAKSGKPFRVGVLLPVQDEPSTGVLLKAMQATAADNNITLTVQYLDDSFSSSSQQPVKPPKMDQSEADIRDASGRFSGKIKGVFALSDSAASHAVDQYEAQGRSDVAIVGFLGSFSARDAMKRGGDSPWKAEISRSAVGLGKAAIAQVAASLRGEKVVPIKEVEM